MNTSILMEKSWFFIFSASFFLFLFLILKQFLVKPTPYKNLPPSPPSFPIIGHLHLLKQPIHRTLHSLSNKYGPILNLSFGNRRVLLVSSPSAAEECFTNSDIVFANRPRLLAGKYLTYDYTTMVAAPHGDHWRNLRRLASLEFFSTSRLNMFLGLRQDEILFLIKMLYQSCRQNFTKVEMKSKLFALSFNIIMRMVSGKRYFGLEIGESEEAKRFREIIREIFEVSGASNPGDFLPFLRWLDFQSHEKRIITVHSKSDRFMQNLIDEHRNKRNCSAGERRIDTIIDSMLSLQDSQPEYYSDEIIKGMVTVCLSFNYYIDLQTYS